MDFGYFRKRAEESLYAVVTFEQRPEQLASVGQRGWPMSSIGCGMFKEARRPAKEGARVTQAQEQGLVVVERLK